MINEQIISIVFVVLVSVILYMEKEIKKISNTLKRINEKEKNIEKINSLN
jgi:hypothetical protein